MKPYPCKPGDRDKLVMGTHSRAMFVQTAPCRVASVAHVIQAAALQGNTREERACPALCTDWAFQPESIRLFEPPREWYLITRHAHKPQVQGSTPCKPMTALLAFFSIFAGPLHFPIYCSHVYVSSTIVIALLNLLEVHINPGV